MAVEGDALVFYLNGKKVIEPCPDPGMSLVRYLRDKLLLRGSKVACEEGGCGSCTVMVSRYDRRQKNIIHEAVVACLLPLCEVQGCALTTIEGLGNTKTGLHDIQKRLVEAFGIQCGFCTPGMVMSCYTLLRNNPKPTAEDIEYALEGNLCRCTGYRPILKAFSSFSEDFQCGLGDKCCRNASSEKSKDRQEEEEEQEQEEGNKGYRPYDPTQEPIFPPELQLSDEFNKGSTFIGDKVTWLQPVTMDTAMEMLRKHPTSTVVSGYTQQVFLQRDLDAACPQVILSLANVEEMKMSEDSETGVSLGASLTVNECIQALKRTAALKTGSVEVAGVNAVLGVLERVGSVQIRNMATIGGSLFSRKDNSDVILSLLTAGASLTFSDRAGKTETTALDHWMEDDIFQARKNVIVTKVSIPFTKKGVFILCEKQMWRRAFSGSVVNAGLRLVLDDGHVHVKEASLYFGGLKNNILKASSTSKTMSNKEWKESLIEETCAALSEELANLDQIKKSNFKRTLALSLTFKFLTNIEVLKSTDDPMNGKFIRSLEKGTVRGTQVWEEKPVNENTYSTIGTTHPDVAARQKATGEALFYTDLPTRADELHLGLVQSTHAHARIVKVDITSALEMEGVHGYVTTDDVPGSNITGAFEDEKIFTTDVVETMGEIIGAIVAETEAQARRAARAVKVTYEALPVITTIEEAIKEKSFFEHDNTMVWKGNVAKAFDEAEHVLEGTSRIGNQNHFYMEPGISMVVPSDGHTEYNVYSGGQAPPMYQELVAKALNIQKHKIVVHQKRIGGSYGGKALRTVTLLLLPAAVAAYKFGRPVRAQFSREQDMAITGGRHSFLFNHKVGFTSEGKLTATSFDCFPNGGSVKELTPWVGECALLSLDGAYIMENFLAKQFICKTNTPSPTAMRGFGRPQSTFAVETAMNDIADTLGILPEKVRRLNLLEPGASQPLGKPLYDCSLKECWDHLMKEAQVEQRRRDIEDFNRKNTWRKRGICIIPTSFANGHFLSDMSQAGALVNVYTDGTVMLAHGDTEMGQGINTKMIQIASNELNIPPNMIHIMETSTNTVPNATMSGGSIGSEIYGGAVIDACKKIMTRLEAYRKAKPESSWSDWVSKAYSDRVSLSATGFYKTDNITFDYKTMTGHAGNYCSYGAACSEVEIDCLTGQHVILRADLVNDVGKSLNPGIDIGQIEGGYMQGVGLYTIEEMAISPEGKVLTCNSDTYKIPTVADIPRKINVTLMKGHSKIKTLYSAKNMGEPPLMGALSVFFAIKDAIKAARVEAGLTGTFRLDSPATPERIRMACPDRLSKMVTKIEEPHIPNWTY